jgi:hypothetical protein
MIISNKSGSVAVKKEEIKFLWEEFKKLSPEKNEEAVIVIASRFGDMRVLEACCREPNQSWIWPAILPENIKELEDWIVDSGCPILN